MTDSLGLRDPWLLSSLAGAACLAAGAALVAVGQIVPGVLRRGGTSRPGWTLLCLVAGLGASAAGGFLLGLGLARIVHPEWFVPLP